MIRCPPVGVEWYRLLLLGAIALGSANTAFGQTDPTGSPDPAELTRQVRAIFTTTCAECHGSHLVEPKGDFGFIEDLARVADDPDLVHPTGDPARSELWSLIEWDLMPPPESDVPPLTAAEKQSVRQWLAAGAPTRADDASADAAPPPNEAANAESDGEAGRDAADDPQRTASAEKTDWRRTLRWLGRFHPATTHFPIALLFAALLAEVLLMARHAIHAVDGRPAGDAGPVDPAAGLATTVRFCITLGTIGAVVAAALGWLNGWFTVAVGPRADLLSEHRLLGTITAVIALGVWMNSERVARDPAASRWPLRTALLILCGLVALTGHWGGLLVHGVDYYQW